MSSLRIDQNSVIAGNTRIRSTRLDADMLAMDDQSGFCYSMNAPAARIWELVQKPVKVSELCALLCSEFSVDQNACYQSTVDILLSMKEAGLITVSDAPAV